MSKAHLNFTTPYGLFYDNVAEGDYTIWPQRGVEIRRKDAPDDPFPEIILVVNGVIGPPAGPDENGNPRMCGVESDEWHKMELKGVYVATSVGQKLQGSTN